MCAIKVQLGFSAQSDLNHSTDRPDCTYPDLGHPNLPVATVTHSRTADPKQSSESYIYELIAKIT